MLNKRRISVWVLAFGMAAGASLVARADDGPGGGPGGPGGNAPPGQGQNDQGGPGGPGGGQGGANGRQRGGPPAGFHLIPRFVEEKLNLTDDQKTQMAALEKETKAKLEKILTPEQVKILATARPPGRPGGGRGQGGPGGGPGGPDSENQKRPGDGNSSGSPQPPQN